MLESEFTEIIERLLTVGVPPTAVAKAFDIDTFVVKERLNDLRAEKAERLLRWYVDSDLVEAGDEFGQWDDEVREFVAALPEEDR